MLNLLIVGDWQSLQRSVEHFFDHFFLSKLDSLVIKTLERHFFTFSECLSNVLITRESNFDENNGQSNVQLIRGSFLKK